MLPLALVTQHWTVFALGSVTLLVGGIWNGLLFGLWAAVLVVGLLCIGFGATLHEWALHRKQQRQDRTPESTHLLQARLVKLSGFAYVALALVVAGWLHPVLMTTLLAAILADFAAGHLVARELMIRAAVASLR